MNAVKQLMAVVKCALIRLGLTPVAAVQATGLILTDILAMVSVS